MRGVAFGDSGRDASLPECFFVTAAAVGAVGEQSLWPELPVAASWWNKVHEREQLGDVVAIPGSQRYGQGDTPPLADHVVL